LNDTGIVTAKLKSAIIGYIKEGGGYAELCNAITEKKSDISIWNFISDLKLEAYKEWAASFLSLNPNSAIHFDENARLSYNIVLENDSEKLALTKKEVEDFMLLAKRFWELDRLFPVGQKDIPRQKIVDSLSSVVSNISFKIEIALHSLGGQNSIARLALGGGALKENGE